MKRLILGMICGLILFVFISHAIDPESVTASYVPTDYMDAILSMSTATVPATNDTIQLSGYSGTGSDTVQVLLSGDIESASIFAHCTPVRVHVYNGATISDSAFIWPGTSKTMQVTSRDSLRIVRNKGVTRVDWDLFTSKLMNSNNSYMRRFTKTCPISHGDTLAVGGTVTYTQDQANMDAAGHSGTCVYFESLHIMTTGQDLTQKLGTVLVKMWMGDHQVYGGVVPANVWTPIDFCRFDSLTITDNNDGTLDYISWSLSWNNRL